jgi:hypothetical protein
MATASAAVSTPGISAANRSANADSPASRATIHASA